MAIPISISEFTLLTLLYLLLFPFPISSLNVTGILSPYSQFSYFASLLSTVAADLSSCSSVTILAVPNDNISYSSSNLADAIRYHVLLDNLSPTDLRLIPPSGINVTTLYHHTGRAADNSGLVHVTHNSSSDAVRFQSLLTGSTATMIPLTQTLIPDHNVSILPVDSLLIPFNPARLASETQPPPPPPRINITQQLIDGHNFNIAALMFTGSDVVSHLQAAEGGAGITIFVPTDAAFSDLPPLVSVKSMPADQKSILLEFHVLHSYYPLGTLESIVNPIYPTLATEQIGAGKFTVNISRVNGTVAIDTGVVLASITQTVFDQNPVSIFGVSRVLLPREYFGGGVVVPSGPLPNSDALSPENPPGQSTAVSSSALPFGGVRWRIYMAWGSTVASCVLLLYS